MYEKSGILISSTAKFSKPDKVTWIKTTTKCNTGRAAQ